MRILLSSYVVRIKLHLMIQERNGIETIKTHTNTQIHVYTNKLFGLYM